MSRRRRRDPEGRQAAAPVTTPQSPAAPPRRSTFVEAAQQYFSGGLGLRANIILGSIALMGLLIFVLTSLAGPLTEDNGNGAPGPTVFATRTPAP